MLVSNSTSSSTATPGSSSSASNTLEPPSASASQQQQLLHLQKPHQQQSSSSPLYQNHNHSAHSSRPPSRAPSILDSPTLARVERARLRLEQENLERRGSNTGIGNGGGGGSNATTITRNGLDSLERGFNIETKQSLLAGRIPVGSMTGAIKRGLLWHQRDRLFSRWKERFFVLTRDYLHCFKRASGSANERASDMGQFIFKIKLVDVDKVEWLNRRSYSAIALSLDRESRVLLRCDDGLEDWFELLEECTMVSKQRRQALKIAQGPRSRASLAAPVSHATLQQSAHYGLGSTYSSALDDWLMTNGSGGGGGGGIYGMSRHKIGAGNLNGYAGANPFLFSDSVPDLSTLNNEHHLLLQRNGIATNHSTPQKLPYGAAAAASAAGTSTPSNGHNNSTLNMSRFSNGYVSQNSSYCHGLYGSPRRVFINSSLGTTAPPAVVDEEDAANSAGDDNADDEAEVQLRRRPRLLRGESCDNGNESSTAVARDWLYRKPRAPTIDMRHSVQPMLPVEHVEQHKTKVEHATADVSAHDSGLDTPPSTHRPSSYREPSHGSSSTRDSTETNVSSSRGTLLTPRIKDKAVQQTSSRCKIQERILKMRNDDDCLSNGHCDQNQNGLHYRSATTTPTKLPIKHQQQQQRHNSNMSNCNENGNNERQRFAHPALAAIMSEAQSLRFRDRSLSDCQQLPPTQRRYSNNNHQQSPLATRRSNIPILGTPTRV